ncbi:MAG: hypothetical protein Q9207_006724, partial [Kuettlingeria erythrocarpa]
RADGTKSYEYFLVSELASTISSYAVAYLPNNGGIAFTLLGSGKTYGPLTDAVFAGNAPAEVVLAPPLANGDTQLIVSNRNATFYKDLPNPDPKNATKIASDTLASFTLPKASDSSKALLYRGVSPAGGLFPRHFSINRKGDLVAVGLQNSGRVVVYERCLQSGKIGDRALADIEGLGAVTSVVWDEGEELQQVAKGPVKAPQSVPGAAALASAAAALAAAAPLGNAATKAASAAAAAPKASTDITITIPKEAPKEAPKASVASAAPAASAAPGKAPVVSITV